MKKTLFIFLMFLMMTALSATVGNVETTVDPTEWKPTGKGDSTTTTFKVTFEGSAEGVLYYDFGFSNVPTSVTSAGLNKGTIDNNAITMAHSGAYSGETYNYTATTYAYWYCSFNKAKTLKMIVTPGLGCTVKVTYTPYTYSITSSTLDTSGSAGSATTVTATSDETKTVDLAKFADAIAVYHGNSKLDFDASVTRYPENGVIATVTLKLEENT